MTVERLKKKIHQENRPKIEERTSKSIFLLFYGCLLQELRWTRTSRCISTPQLTWVSHPVLIRRKNFRGRECKWLQHPAKLKEKTISIDINFLRLFSLGGRYTNLTQCKTCNSEEIEFK